MLRVEIADNERDHQKGLMFRKKLADNDGMLFVFSKPAPLTFWGQNTYIPLDIAFVDKNKIIVKISHISPLSEKPVSSEHYCNIAIEANYNYFADNKITEGDQIDYDNITEKIGIVRFNKKIK